MGNVPTLNACNDNPSFAEAVISAINNRPTGMTIKDLSEKSGVPAVTIRTWLYRKHSGMNISLAEKVLATLGYYILLIRK